VNQLQNNIFCVTSHIRKKLEEAGETDLAGYAQKIKNWLEQGNNE
jgi:hypothetical protein